MNNAKFIDKFNVILLRPTFISMLFLIAGIFFALVIVIPLTDTLEQDRRNYVKQYTNSVRDNIQYQIFTRLNLNKAVAAHIADNPRITSVQYDDYITNLSYFWTGIINTMSFSKGHVITYTAPYYHNSNNVIGVDLYSDSTRKMFLEKSVEMNQPFVEGPRNLIGTDVPSIIIYVPIYLRSTDSVGRVFYGFIDATLLWDKILQETPLRDSNAQINIAIRGINGTGATGKCFYGDSSLFTNDDAYRTVLYLPSGEWLIAAYPTNGYNRSTTIILVVIFMIIFITLSVFLITKRSFRLVKESEQKYELITENTSEAIWIVDMKTKVYKYMSSASLDVLGYKPVEMVGHSTTEFVPSESAVIIQKYLNEEMIKFVRGETEKLHATYEVQKYHKNGSLVWLEVSETIMPDKNNALTEILGVSRRIDTRKQNELKIMEQQQQLEVLNATKDKFFSIVAHDLKNPMAAMLNIVQVLHDYHKQLSAEDIEKNISRLYQVSDNIYRLLEGLLQWARSSSGTMTYLPASHNIVNIIKETSEYLTEQAAGKNISISVEALTQSTDVICDINMIETVVRNLTSNAIKFSNFDTTIKLVVADAPNNDFVKVSIIDSGVGMPADKLEKLFKIGEKISTVGTNKEIGTGLGLILCKEFIDRHGCEIGVESTLNVGTTFSFTLKKDKQVS